MSHEVIVQAEAGRLVGRTAHDAEVLAELEGGTYRAVLTIPRGRSLSQLNLWWAMCGLIAENYGDDLTKDEVSDVLKIECGHCRVWKDAQGLYRRSPKSIAFNALAAPDFSALLDKAFGKAAELFGAGLSEAVRAELDAMAAPEMARAA